MTCLGRALAAFGCPVGRNEKCRGGGEFVGILALRGQRGRGILIKLGRRKHRWGSGHRTTERKWREVRRVNPFGANFTVIAEDVSNGLVSITAGKRSSAATT